jgi:hypothetical protein
MIELEPSIYVPLIWWVLLNLGITAAWVGALLFYLDRPSAQLKVTMVFTIAILVSTKVIQAAITQG